MRLRIGFALAPLLAACVPSYQFGGEEDAGTAGDAAMVEPFIECHSGGGDVFTRCDLGRQACCGVFAAIPDFCVDLPDVDASCASPGATTALIACDDPRQCADGSVCCAANLDLGKKTYTAIGCMPQASCVAPFGVLCGNVQGGAVATACTGGTACTAPIDDYMFCN